MRAALTALLLAGLAGCHQKMAIQPSYRPQSPSAFFPDGRADRPTVAGTVARGQLAARTDAALYHGKDAKGALTAEFPYPVTADVLKRGEQRYNVFCAMCHGLTGEGDGRVVKRGFTPPPSYSTDASRAYQLKGEKVLLTDVPVGHLYDVITRGYGAMADYSAQIPVHDRWAIVAYVRALQYSRSPALREKLGKEKAK
ncbi:MAG: c-type cytochrome [Gemmataceae bacterium]